MLGLSPVGASFSQKVYGGDERFGVPPLRGHGDAAQKRSLTRRMELQRVVGALQGALVGRVDPFGGCPEAAFFARYACNIARRLPDEHCRAWHLHCVEEHTHAEVAAALCCSVATTKRRVSAAARALAAA